MNDAIFTTLLEKYKSFPDKTRFRFLLDKEYPHEAAFLKSKNQWWSDLSLPAKLFVLSNNLQDFPLCDCGGKITKFINTEFSFAPYCGKNGCFVKKTIRLEKYQQTCLEKYGVPYTSQADTIKSKIKEGMNSLTEEKKEEIKNKRKSTNLQRYGSVAPAGNSEVLQKMKETNMSKYGVHYILEDNEKVTAAVEKKYGVKNVMHVPEISKKMKETRDTDLDWREKRTEKTKKVFLEKYGEDNPMKVSDIKERVKETTQRRYGVTTILQLEEIRSKVSEFNTKKVLKRIKSFKSAIPLFEDHEYCGIEKEYGWLCQTCKSEFISDLTDGKYPKCPKCFPYAKSKEELNLKKFLEDLNVDVLHNKKPFGKYEIDLLIPSKKVAIEYNGLYWHSENVGTDKNYHKMKTELAEKNGYQLLHVFENEWLQKPDIVKSIIMSKLGKNEKVYARKCELKKISVTDKNAFLDTHHIQGSDKSSVRYGLFYKNELVSVMTFGKPRFNKNYEWELIRFASKQGVTVVGAFSKLLHHFKKDFNATSIISYADRRYSVGDVYIKNGFVLSHISPPNFWIFNKKTKKLESRLNWQKHKLSSKLEHFDPTLTAKENIDLAGYFRIWDSGNLVFVLN